MKKILPLFFFLAIVSCNNVDESLVQIESDTEVSKEDIATEMIVRFVNTDKNQSRSKSDVLIKEIYTKYYKIIDNKVQFISDNCNLNVDLEDCSDAFSIDRVSFSIDDKLGYAFMSQDEGVKNIYYFTDNGCVEDTAFIVPLKEYVETIPYLVASIKVGKEAVNKLEFDCRSGEDYDIFSPIVPFNWSQGYPFNMYAPSCDCPSCTARNGHMPSGCTVTAVAQTIATIGVFDSKFYTNRNINFSNLPSDVSEMNQSQKSQIGHFFHEISMNIQVKYSCSGTSGSMGDILNYFEDMNYAYNTNNGNLDLAETLVSLSKGYPVLAMGADNNTGAHMWVVDGVRISNSSLYIHSNWGWGTSSGYHYYFTNAWELDYFYDNKKQIYIRSINN